MSQGPMSVVGPGCVKTRMRSQRHAAETGCRKAWLLAADRGLDGPAIRTSRQGFGPTLINALTTLQGQIGEVIERRDDGRVTVRFDNGRLLMAREPESFELVPGAQG